ncbi:alpha/beta hydrolase [Skermania piniformis]|uniref:Alpha/beta hydrolase n=1 Tax=Skermania pinensis TaxID=39122 RepID=A0ABX8SEW0_9ACTN|nr:alpha/beta hydrolase [Skermania piniformis]
MPDVLDGYLQRQIPLGTDPDGEGEIGATLVRREPATPPPSGLAVLYVHGYTDYFFQRHVGTHFAERGYAFYALDLRKCGRSRRPGQTAHYVGDLALYDTELDEALRIVRAETGARVLVLSHSTGGLVTSLWLHRRNTDPAYPGGAPAAGICGIVLNSPWFDLHGPAMYRSVGTTLIGVAGRLRGRAILPGQSNNTYGSSLHSAAHGDWDFDTEWKPLSGIPIRLGWLRAVRRGQARLHRGLNLGTPALVLRSNRSRFAVRYEPAVDLADAVLDVDQIQRWAGCLGGRTTIVPIPDARHDVFLSAPTPLATAFAELDLWLDWLERIGTAGRARVSAD